MQVILCLAACGEVEAPDAGTPDAAVDAGTIDAAAPAIGDVYEQGELIAIYDRRLWATFPADELVYAFFDPDLFAPYPDDRSITFSSDEHLPFSPRTPLSITYRDLLRRERIAIDRVPLMGRAYVITAGERYHLTENGYGDFAWDLVKTDARGIRFNGTGARNEDHLVWDQPVLLPTGGYVVEVVNDSPDNAPGVVPPDPIENLVGVHLGGSYYLYLLHFRQGSILPEVQVGAILPAGALLGAVGNSGLSLEPHLHLSLLWFDGERSWSLPIEFTGIATATSAAGPAVEHEWISPSSGVWIE